MPRLAWGAPVLAVALVAGLGIGPARAAIPAGGHVSASRHAVSAADQTLEAPLVDSVDPAADGTVLVTVTPGDTAGEAVSVVDVYAYALDDNGDPTGAPVATGKAKNPSPLNPPAVSVSGLADDAEYAFEATETTASGAVSAFSPPSIGGPVAPAAPLAPTLASVLGRDTKIKAAWDPSDPDGSAVTSYTVTATPTDPSDPPVTVSVGGNDNQADITGLVNGVPYGISVTAASAVGTSPAGKSDSETEGAAADGTVTPRTAYGASAPQDVSAAPPPAGSDGSQPDPTALLVSWDPPFDDGGSAIDGYRVDATAAGQPPVSASVAAPATQATLTGLTPGVSYSVTVTGTQHKGDLSATSAPVTAASDPLPAAGTIVLSADSVAAITALTPTTVTFTSPPAQVSALAVGNIITVEQNSNPLTADGLLRQVDQVATDGSTVTLTTSEAALTDAFSSLDFTAAGNDQDLPTSSSPMAIHVLDPDFQASLAPALKIPLEKTFTIDLAEKLTKDPKEKARLGGNPSLSTELNIGLGVPLNFDLTADLLAGTYDFTATATPKASIGGKLGIAYKSETERKPILTIEPSCFWIYVVAMCPKLTLYAQASVDGSISFSFSASYEKTFGGQIARDAAGKTTTKDITTAGVSTFDYSLTAAAKLSFAFPISFQVLVYGLAGPELTITPSLELSADTAANPWLTVAVRVQVGIYFLLSIKFATFSGGGTVLDKSFPLYSTTGPFPVPYLTGSSAPGSKTIPLQVFFPGGCDPSQGVTWAMAPGSLGTVSPSGLYTPPSPLPKDGLTDLVDATTAGSPGCPSFTARKVARYGESTPGAPTAAAISPDGSTVSWLPPADGGTVTQYVVTVLANRSNPAGAQTVLGTAPGTDKTLAIPANRIPQIVADGAAVQVTAINKQGQGPPSAPSLSAPATDPVPVLFGSASAGSTTIALAAGVTNRGPNTATGVTFQIAYPSVLTPPSSSACTNDAAARVLTCSVGPVSSGGISLLGLTFTLGQLVTYTQYPITLTRLSATPYPRDPYDGTLTAVCTAFPAGNVTCK